MLSRRFYYELKPFLPWRMRMMLRRILARRKRRKCGDIWPIDEFAGRAPPGWPGWPEEKKFAVVLTHDVEGPEGLEKVQRLAELEMELGFRSCFNFIPEGPYAVPFALRSWLLDHGFEVGVHDLHHDGRLFASRRSFKRDAARINDYVREWGAAGFRSGFMLRNLDWMHDLNIQYDTSTFDTDPFELQPEGTGTIFPFWVPAPEAPGERAAAAGAERVADSRLKKKDERADESSSFFALPSSVGVSPFPLRSSLGYVELPYTLPQDSTLFLVLRETTPEIWLRKLDWIAEHGGMALVNVHPDYMDFAGTHRASREYAVTMYADLLRHVAEKHAGRYWNAVPRDLTSWFQGVRQAAGTHRSAPAAVTPGNGPAAASSGLRGKRAAVLLYSYYPSDARPRRAAEAMIEAGMEVDLFCLSESDGEPASELVGGVRVFRLPMRHRRDSRWAYLRQYGRFLFSSFWFLARRGLRRRYDVVHVHNMPDVLVFSALIPKLRGARVILDLHDPMPELMMTIFGSNERSAGIWVLKRLEKWSIGFADAVLTVNEACKKLFSARSGPPEKIRVVMNTPDERIFRYREPVNGTPPGSGSGKRFVIMYHGSLVERHGLDLAVTALGKVRPSLPGVELWVFGHDTPFLRNVMSAVQNSDLRDAVRYFGPKTLEQIVEAIGECDVGIVPNRRSIFTEINTPTRIFEYLSQAKPVIAPRAAGILDYFGPEDLIYFELGDADDLAAKIEHVFRQPEVVDRIVRRGQKVYRDHSWHRERSRFVQTVAEVLGVAGPPPVRVRAAEAGPAKGDP